MLGLTGCNSILGIQDLEGPPDTGPIPPFPGDGPDPTVDCRAQRVVHLVAGSGGLAWFTLAWPVPHVITNFTPTFSFDDPQRAVDQTSDGVHPLFVRVANGRILWEGTGANPHPTVVLAGNNETHTATPQSTTTSGGSALVPLAAALQQSTLAPPLPALVFGNLLYGTAPGAPAPVNVAANDIDGAIAALQATGAVTPQIEAQLRPTMDQLATYVPPGAPNSVVTLGTQLAFTANAFRFGLIGSVMMPAFNDDPHGAWTDPNGATARADQLATMLDTFYRELAVAPEICGSGGLPISVADNTVMLVSGDTYKNAFDRSGWSDGTLGNSNLLYVRSNGFTKPGWFGSIVPGMRTLFNPMTGALDPMSSTGANTQAGFAAALHAIARGDQTYVSQATNAVYDGLILR